MAAGGRGVFSRVAQLRLGPKCLTYIGGTPARVGETIVEERAYIPESIVRFSKRLAHKAVRKVSKFAGC